ncbi:hypothetical protein CWI36_1129p0010, partial [Hamiltosporidium magnivora]
MTILRYGCIIYFDFELIDCFLDYKYFCNLVKEYSKDNIKGCEELFLEQYKNEKIKQKFFNQLFNSLKYDDDPLLLSYIDDKIMLSISGLKTEATEYPENIFLKNLNDSRSKEYKIVMNLCVYSFWNLILNIFAFFENYKLTSKFLLSDDNINLLKEKASSENSIFVIH